MITTTSATFIPVPTPLGDRLRNGLFSHDTALSSFHHHKLRMASTHASKTQQLSTWRHRYAPDVPQNTEFVFGLTVLRDTPILLAPREHTAYQWLPWREAADKCFSPSNAEAVLQLPRYVQA